jgi:hypothetical protein
MNFCKFRPVERTFTDGRGCVSLCATVTIMPHRLPLDHHRITFMIIPASFRFHPVYSRYLISFCYLIPYLLSLSDVVLSSDSLDYLLTGSYYLSIIFPSRSIQSYCLILILLLWSPKLLSNYCLFHKYISSGTLYGRPQFRNQLG